MCAIIVKTCLESGIRVTSPGDKDQLGLSYLLHYREIWPPTCAEHNLCAIRRSQLVQVNRLVSYPLLFTYLRFNLEQKTDLSDCTYCIGTIT